MKLRKAKWRRRLRAWVGGYFWLPCDVCGEWFGGQEPYGIVPLTESSGRCICVLCAVERQQIAEQALLDGRYPITVSNDRAVHALPFAPLQFQQSKEAELPIRVSPEIQRNVGLRQAVEGEKELENDGGGG